MIEALMLFGSAARGDSDCNSDVDLLAISRIQRPFSRKTHQAELQFQNPTGLLKSASDGELFAIHLAFEGRVIFDTTGVFSQFKESLVIRNEYSREISWGIDLAWFLHDFGMNKNPKMVNKRIAWCVRTIVISKLVETGKIIFSPKALAREYPHHHVSDLIGLRRSDIHAAVHKRQIKVFLRSIDAPHPSATSEEDYFVHFKATENLVALQTFNNLMTPEAEREAFY